MVRATKKSIRLRILKLSVTQGDAFIGVCYKKIDPFADTETLIWRYVIKRFYCYKKIDPFADTETRHAILGIESRHCYKKIDPFADTETC